MSTNHLFSYIMPPFSSKMQSYQTFDPLQTFECLAELYQKKPQLSDFQNMFACKTMILNNFTRFSQLQQPFASSYQTYFVKEYDDVDPDLNCVLADVYSEESVESHRGNEYKYSDSSTNTFDINAGNVAFDRFLSQKSSTFVWSILHIDFEDGVSNDIIEEVRRYMNENKYVTICWLNSLFSQNQTNQDLLAALLRTVAMTISVYDSDKLMPMVIAGLVQPSSKTQEAALAVIEEWRTKPCLQALQNLEIHSNWVKNMQKVKRELEEELGCSLD